MSSSTTELFEAIRAGDLARLEALVGREPALASASNPSGLSAVLAAIYSGRPEIRDALLAKDPALPLAEAAAVGRLDRVRQIVASDPASANSYSSDGFPVVALAAVFGRFEVARYLAANGADINAAATNGTGYNALTGAVASGHTEIVRWLLDSGADPQYRYGPGYTPLLTAAANGHAEIVKLLLSHGASAAARTDEGKNAAALATERNHPEVAALLKDC